jgi:hypothetical protein
MISGTDGNGIASFHQRTTLGLTSNYLVPSFEYPFRPDNSWECRRYLIIVLTFGNRMENYIWYVVGHGPLFACQIPRQVFSCSTAFISHTSMAIELLKMSDFKWPLA